ncbi:hypothetical protein PQX77_008928 [Marasmius sp. AFHP31]|nr:hypothetical protein PQX77_008928 [Marasmius sp. AFHP31]
MYHHPSYSYCTDHGQRTFSGPERPGTIYSTSWRDLNINSGSGTFTINNDNRVIQQARSTYRHIRGTEEEEAEYEEYGEYKRGDIQLLERIYHEKSGMFDYRRGQLTKCERNIYIGQVMAGDGIGRIVTVEAFTGDDAPGNWKERFATYSGRLCVNNAHLHALNRSRVPLLIFSGGLVPIAHLKSLGWVAEIYLSNLIYHPQLGQSNLSELWVDSARGVVCRGPDGPYPKINPSDWVVLGVKNLPLTTDLLQRDVFMRFLGTKRSKDTDDVVVERIDQRGVRHKRGVPDSFNQPIIFSTLTQTPIATANNFWWSRKENLVARKVLGNSWTRFRLNGDENEPWLQLSTGRNDCGGLPKAWILQASSIFYSRGISLEGDLSVYQLAYRHAILHGSLDESPSKSQRRRRLQPIYLIVLPLPLDFDGYTSSLHFWSFHEDGQPRLSPESCNHFGLPVELKMEGHEHYILSWATEYYKGLHEYQLSRGFDPKTINFARHLGYADHIFHPVNDSDRFKEVYEGQKYVNGPSESNANPDSENSSNARAQDQRPVRDADCCGGLQIRGASCDRKDEFSVSGGHIAHNTELGELESNSHPDQDLLHRDVTVSNDMAADSLVRFRSPESTSGCYNGPDLLAGNTTNGAGTAPRIQSAVNSTTTSHEINHAQNVGRVGTSPSAPLDGANNRIHNDGLMIQHAPLRKRIRVSRTRSFKPPTSLTALSLAAPHASPISVEVLPFVPSNTESLRSLLPGSGAPTAPRRNQRYCLEMVRVLEGQNGDRMLE